VPQNHFTCKVLVLLLNSSCNYFSKQTYLAHLSKAQVLWLADTLSTSSQEQLQGSTPILAQMFLMGSQPSVVTFCVDTKSNMATLASDWPIHFQHFFSKLASGIYSKLGTNISYVVPPKCCYFLSGSEISIWPPRPLIGWHIFNFLSSMATVIYSKLGINVPYGVLTKCCYFLNGSEIQEGHLGLWLADLQEVDHL